MTHTRDVEFEGHVFRVSLEGDSQYGPPWLEEDGHGPVSELVSRAANPGEWGLGDPRRALHRYYDAAGALQKAREEGWAPQGERYEDRDAALKQAVREDYQRLQAWMNDQWHYMQMTVELLDECKCCGHRSVGDSAYLGGLASDDGEGIEATAEEMMWQLLEDQR